jgi:hypothetical protein
MLFLIDANGVKADIAGDSFLPRNSRQSPFATRLVELRACSRRAKSVGSDPSPASTGWRFLPCKFTYRGANYRRSLDPADPFFPACDLLRCQTLDRENSRFAGLVAQSLEGLVFRRGVPALHPLHAVEGEHDNSLWGFSSKRLHIAAAY